MQDINIPIIGGRGLMTLVALAHILLVSVAGTGPLMAYLIEGVGLRRGDGRYVRESGALDWPSQVASLRDHRSRPGEDLPPLPDTGGPAV